MTDTDLNNAISSGPDQVHAWLQEHLTDLTLEQGFKISQVARHLPALRVESLLRVVAPVLGQHFQAGNNSLDGLNPTVVKLSRHLHWCLAQF